MSTFICVTVSLILGAIILVSNFGTNWHVANANISSPYRAFSKEKIFANIGVCVGLQSVNITLQALPFHQRSDEINYNERFYWIDPLEMKIEHKKALAKGLPFPILTVAEYLSQDGEGFCWGRRYRLAGYYSSVLLWASFITWILMNVLLCAVPKYGVYLMELTGILMLSTNAIYTILLPKKPLIIPFEKEKLSFQYGWCFWAVLAGGLLAVIIGSILTIIDAIFPNKFSTILEIDYDTPYRYFVNASSDSSSTTTSSSNNNAHASATVTSSAATESTTCCLHSTSGTHINHSNKSTCRSIKRNSVDDSLAEDTYNDDDDLSDENCSCVDCHPPTCADRSHRSSSHQQQHTDCEECISRSMNSTRHPQVHEMTSNLSSLHKFKSDSVIAVENSKQLSSTTGKTPLCKSVTTTATIEYNDHQCNHDSHLHHHHHHHQKRSNRKNDEKSSRRASSSISSTYTKSQVKSFTFASNGVTNNAYVDDESDAMKINKEKNVSHSLDESLDQNNSSSDEIITSTTIDPLDRQSKVTNQPEIQVDDDDDGHRSDSSEISTTIIDGKRAISLHNFGKFAAQQSKAAASAASTSTQQYTQYNRFVSQSIDPSVSRYNSRYHDAAASVLSGVKHHNSSSGDHESSHKVKSSHHRR